MADSTEDEPLSKLYDEAVLHVRKKYPTASYVIPEVYHREFVEVVLAQILNVDDNQMYDTASRIQMYRNGANDVMVTIARNAKSLGIEAKTPYFGLPVQP